MPTSDDFDFEPDPNPAPLRNIYEEMKAQEPRWVSIVAACLVIGFVAFIVWRLIAEATYRDPMEAYFERYCAEHSRQECLDLMHSTDNGGPPRAWPD